MRYLDRNWIDEQSEDPMSWLNLQVYQRHLEDIADDLPSNARALAALSMGIQLQGSEIAATSLDEDLAKFTLVLKVLTFRGDGWLEIDYEDVDLDEFEIEPFENAESLLTDEFDLAPDGRFEHRLLFEPDGEGHVQFKDLKIRLRVDGDDDE